ncbi:C-GCAxxG-C-C family protein [bacterium 210820-DFI.6.37]|nr:C-GCAxxG-C-C family protein [bacterium 210820-DFI.6.37]
MAMVEMNEEKALECFAGGLDCSQVVFGYGAELIGYDKDTAMKIAAAFGGGMWKGETCGCVTGALMAIGLKYGHFKLGDEESKNKMLAVREAFEKEFTAQNGSLICKEILGYDLSKEEELEKIREEQLLVTKCPQLACCACDILEELL